MLVGACYNGSAPPPHPHPTLSLPTSFPSLFRLAGHAAALSLERASATSKPIGRTVIPDADAWAIMPRVNKVGAVGLSCGSSFQQ